MYEYISVCVYLGSCQHFPGRMKAVQYVPGQRKGELTFPVSLLPQFLGLLEVHAKGGGHYVRGKGHSC
jgi:hypothetical protein